MKEFAALPSIDMEATGCNIKRLRIKAGLKVKDIQEIFGFGTVQAIYRWERGDALPAIDNLVVLSRVFGVPIDKILVINDPGPAKVA